MNPPAQQLISDWLMRFDPDTRAAYRSDVDQFQTWLGDTDLLTVDRATIQRWLAHLLDERELTPTTVQRKRSAVSSFFTYAVQEKILPSSPATHVLAPRGESEPRLGLELTQAKKLIAAALDHSRSAHALVWLMSGAGLRVAEACSAQIEDLDGDSVVVTVKGRRRQRKPLSQPVLEAVTAAIGDRTSGPILTNRDGRRLTPPRARELVARLATSTGIKDCTPHTLRHTAASIAIAAGAGVEEVQQLLGHKSLATTVLYIHNRDLYQEARSAATRLGDALTKTSRSERPND